MDLTSLSSTLPSQSRNARESQYDYPPAALMSAFKQAAMSVTTLYKSANTEIERARKQGYQDAIDDLLQLINSDRIHGNSEVAKIREWGLSKRRKNGGEAEGGAHGDSIYESEDERGQPRTTGSSSPMRESEPPVRSPPQPQPEPQPQQPEPVSSPSYSPPSPPEPREKSSSFTFRSNHHYPRHPPPPPRAPMLEDIELPDTTPGSPVSTPLGEQSLHHINPNIPPVSQRATSGAWKRRFPFDFLELAAMAEKEKQAYAGMDFPNNKRGRMT